MNIRAISFIGTLVVALGALVAATIASMIIINMFNTMNTQPYISVGEAYYVNSTSYTHFHVMLYNAGRGEAEFQYMYIFFPTIIRGSLVNVTILVDSNGNIYDNDTGTPLNGEVVFSKTPPTITSQGALDIVVEINDYNANATNNKIIGIAVFDKDAVTIMFEKI